MASIYAELAAEFVGTFMLVLAVGCNILMKTSSAWAVTSIACTLMVMIYATGPVSGGHLNPSVSLAAGLARKHPWHKVFLYIAAQVTAGITAGFCYCALCKDVVSLEPADTYNWWEAMIVEVFYTAMLAFVVLSVACSKRNNPEGNGNQFYALAIAFVVIAGGYGGGAISGGSFNPAVSLGLDISSYSDGVYQGFTYTAYEVVGAALAAVLFRLTRPEEFKEEHRDVEASLPTKLASEFIGTFFLMLTVGLNVLGSSLASAWSCAAALMSMIYALGDVSGGHFNPAVTLAVVLSKKGGCSARVGAAYVCIQVVAAILASLLYAGLHKVGTFSLEPKPGYTDFAAYGMEFMFTLLLCFVVLSTACVKGITTRLNRNYYFALAIGSCVTVGGVAAGKVSGGSLNPAVSFGISVSNTLNYGQMYYCATYSLAELFAGLTAALLFAVTHVKEYSAKAA